MLLFCIGAVVLFIVIGILGQIELAFKHEGIKIKMLDEKNERDFQEDFSNKLPLNETLARLSEQSRFIGSIDRLPKMNAFVHIGPHKTGTTTIQEYSSRLVKHLLKDGYKMPWSHLDDKELSSCNQVRFATCFLSSNIYKMNASIRRHKIPVKEVYPCRPDLLQSGLEIANQNYSLFISAETFDQLHASNVMALSRYLLPWDNVTIAVTYRRYYEWLVSYHNQLSKGDSWRVFEANATIKLRPSILDSLSDPVWIETLTSKHTLFLVPMFKKEFDNVIVMNLHDDGENGKTLEEQFYCDVLPGGKNTCEKVIQLINQDKNLLINRSSDSFLYQDIAYIAHRSNLINVNTKKQYTVVQSEIKAFYRENTRIPEHVRDNFDLSNSSSRFRKLKLKCPHRQLLDFLLDVSIRAERELVPDFFSSPRGETELKLDFEKRSKTTLCEVDIAAMLNESGWKQFFTKLNMQLEEEE